MDANLISEYGEPYNGNTQFTPTYNTKDINPVATITNAGPNININVLNPTSNSLLRASEYFSPGDFGAIYNCWL